MSYAVDHEVHDGLWHQVLEGLVDDAHVGVHQAANGFHLTLQLRVTEVLRSSVSPPVHLSDTQTRWELGSDCDILYVTSDCSFCFNRVQRNALQCCNTAGNFMFNTVWCVFSISRYPHACDEKK